MRLAKIVATLGPASSDPEIVRAMIRAGMDVARLNTSHGTLAGHAKMVKVVRDAAAAEDKPVAILLDLAGAKLRTGPCAGDGVVELRAGESIELMPGESESSSERIYVSYERLAEDVLPGQRVLLADGDAELIAEEPTGTGLRCRVIDGGEIGPRKGVAFPDSDLALPALTDDDEAAIEMGVREKVDYFGLSFVGQASDVRRVKDRVAFHGGDTMVIAKIERRQAVERLEEILIEADGAMVARGDLGVELPLEQVPIEQGRIIRASSRKLRPVITATQMLDSMIDSLRPTRAEASDVANAIWDLSDAVMLSGETAVGRYPVQTVAMMDRIVRAAESAPPQKDAPAPDLETDNHSFVIADATRRMVEYDDNIKAIVCFSTSGTTAFLLSKVHARVPIYALSPYVQTIRRLALARAVVPLDCQLPDNAEEMLTMATACWLVGGISRVGPRWWWCRAFPCRREGPRTSSIYTGWEAEDGAGNALIVVPGGSTLRPFPDSSMVERAAVNR